MAPTRTAAVRATSCPVVLKITPTVVTETSANPFPRLRSAAPVACSANFWSAWITSASVASLTPTRTTSPAVKRADALRATTTNSSGAVPMAGVFWTPKSPAIVTNPPMVAFNPVNTTPD